MKIIKEWYIEVPWGKIALISWGNPNGEPILMVHGRQDSAATFLPLLELLPDVYHYVAFDLPGHGMSDAFPKGLAIARFFFVTALDQVVKHLQWTNFVYIAHSMGVEIGACPTEFSNVAPLVAVVRHLRWEHYIYIAHSMGVDIGLFYNAIYPGQVKKFILLDGGPAIQRLMIRDSPTYISYYEHYYNNYSKNNSDNRVYSKADAIKAVMKARNMDEAQAEVILSRNLRKIGEDQYRLSWDRRTKLMPPTNYPLEYYYQLFSKNCPPTLFVSANNSTEFYPPGKEDMKKIISDLEKNVKYFTVLRVDGNHDVHFLNPERVSTIICPFLKKEFTSSKSKL